MKETVIEFKKQMSYQPIAGMSDGFPNSAIILAAGASTRMGTCKTSLAWGTQQTLLSYQASEFILAGIIPIIVLAPHNAHQEKICPPESLIVVNPEPNQGKTRSILTGLTALPSSVKTLLISAVDQPRSHEVYQILLERHQEKSALISAPCYQGKLGHPTVFSSQLLGELREIREETQGLRSLIQKYYPLIQKIEFNSPEILLDLNRPEEYQIQYNLCHQ